MSVLYMMVYWPGFQFYQSGVYDEPACSPDRLCLSVLVVGYGTLDNKQYYNCKNRSVFHIC